MNVLSNAVLKRVGVFCCCVYNCVCVELFEFRIKNKMNYITHKAKAILSRHIYIQLLF
jgi:hypothetical protein